VFLCRTEIYTERFVALGEVTHMIAAAILTLVSVMAGVALISLGALMSLHQWATTQHGVIKTRRDHLGPTLTGLSKLVEAVNHEPNGQRLILSGIALLAIAGFLGGLSLIETCS
jgi:hypothetical protein